MTEDAPPPEEPTQAWLDGMASLNRDTAAQAARLSSRRPGGPYVGLRHPERIAAMDRCLPGPYDGLRDPERIAEMDRHALLHSHVEWPGDDADDDALTRHVEQIMTMVEARHDAAPTPAADPRPLCERMILVGEAIPYVHSGPGAFRILHSDADATPDPSLASSKPREATENLD